MLQSPEADPTQSVQHACRHMPTDIHGGFYTSVVQNIDKDSVVLSDIYVSNQAG